jgi:hypothetical protein
MKADKAARIKRNALVRKSMQIKCERKAELVDIYDKITTHAEDGSGAMMLNSTEIDDDLAFVLRMDGYKVDVFNSSIKVMW